MADDGEGRPPKRIRQACEPCRRKKTKCPGEKPNCSFCTRLRQTCTYAEEPSLAIEPPPWAQAFDKLDQKLDALITHLVSPPVIERQQLTLPNNFQPWFPEVDPDSYASSSHHNHIATPRTDDDDPTFIFSEQLPSRSTVLAISKLFAQRCHCQPLPLFRPGVLPESIDTYSWDVLLAILAVALRFSEDTGSAESHKMYSRSYAGKSLQLVTTSVIQGKTELATVQALCLLAFVDLTDGNMQRAWTNIGLGQYLTQSSRFQSNTASTLNPSKAEDHRGCLWSLHMLSLMCNSAERIIPSLTSQTLQYPSSIPKPFNNFVAQMTASDLGLGSVLDLGILAYTIQLTEIWQETLRYSRTRLDPDTKVPWLYDSGYSTITARLMQFETTLPESHRFITGKFSEQDAQSLRNNAGYWGPWLYAQFIYHTIFCLLHHPFLVAQEMKIRSTRFPFTYIDNCAGLVQLHSNWIDIFINLIGSKDFPVSDPFLAYCGSVAAAVHLFFLYSETKEVKEQARSKLRRCYKFISDSSAWWPNIKTKAKNLDIASRRVPEWHRQNPFTPTVFPSVDKTLFWSILNYASDESDQEKSGQSLHIPINQSSTSNPVSDSGTHANNNIVTPGSTSRMPMDINHVISSNETPQNSVNSSRFQETYPSSMNFLEDIDALGVTGNTGQIFDWMGDNANYGFGNYGWPRMGNL